MVEELNRDKAFLALGIEAYKKQLEKKYADEFAGFNKLKKEELKKQKSDLAPIVARVNAKHKKKVTALKKKYENQVADARKEYEKVLIEFKKALWGAF